MPDPATQQFDWNGCDNDDDYIIDDDDDDDIDIESSPEDDWTGLFDNHTGEGD